MSLSIPEWGLTLTETGNEFFGETCQSVKKAMLDMDFRQIPDDSFLGISLPELPSQALVFQLIKAVDISKPVGPEDEGDAETAEEEEQGSVQKILFKSARRTLKLTLVSPMGSLRIEALEVSRISSLTDGCVPGTKILLSGPLKTVAGFVLLERDQSVRILGGRVKRLAEGFKLNEEVKARRKDIVNEQSSASGPPKFVSFLDLKKRGGNSQKKKTETPKVVVVDEPAEVRTVGDSVVVSDKVKELQANKLEADAFAMKERGGKGGKGGRSNRHAARRERDELAEQYKPPSRTAPQLSAFVRLDKVSNLEDAQRLHNAVEESRYNAPVDIPTERYYSHRSHNYERNNGDDARKEDRSHGKGKGKGGDRSGRGKGKGENNTVGKGKGKGQARGEGKGKGKGSYSK